MAAAMGQQCSIRWMSPTTIGAGHALQVALSAATPYRSSTIDAYGSTLMTGFGRHTNPGNYEHELLALLGHATWPSVSMKTTGKTPPHI